MNTSKTVQQSNLSNIGIDVSKKTVHIVALKGNENAKKNFKYDTVPNNIEDVVAYFSENFKVENVGCIVMEATGGYEKKVANTLAKMGYYVSIINPRRSHNWMDALGKNPKTDKSDAQMLAAIAQQYNGQDEVLRRYQPPTENQEKLKQYVDRFKQLTDDSVTYQNRITHAQDVDKNDPTIESMKEMLELIEKQKKEFLKKIRELIASDADLKEKDEILQSVPGVGIGTSAMLMAYMPEMGTLNRQEIASLAGLAPHPNDSGQKTGKRTTKCGRTKIKSNWITAMLSVVRYNPKINEFYNRLTVKGKAKRLALIASMRKLLTILNVMIRNKQKWNEHKNANSETNQNEAQVAAKTTTKKPSTKTKKATTVKSVAFTKKTKSATKTKKQRDNIES